MVRKHQDRNSRFRDLAEHKEFQPNSEPLDPYQVLMNYVETPSRDLYAGHSFNEVSALALVSIATDMRALLDVVSRSESRQAGA